MMNYNNAYTTKQEIIDIAMLNARVRNIGALLTRVSLKAKKILITQSQYEQLYNYLVNQLLGTMQATSTDMSYNNPFNL